MVHKNKIRLTYLNERINRASQGGGGGGGHVDWDQEKREEDLRDCEVAGSSRGVPFATYMHTFVLEYDPDRSQILPTYYYLSTYLLAYIVRPL